MATKKPCPGCDRVVPERRADKVCDRCRSLLQRAEAIEKTLAESTKDMILVAFGTQPHWNEYIHVPHRHGSPGFAGELQKTLWELATAASMPSHQNYAYSLAILGKHEGWLSEGSHRYMDAQVAEAIMALRQLMKQMIAEVYAAGKADGHSLLLRLAEGEISTREFDAKTK